MEGKETLLKLPWDIIDAGQGISFDIGGSVAKISYLHKDDYIKCSERKEDSVGQLRLVSFPREQLDKAMDYIKTHVHIIGTAANKTTQIFTTGCGAAHFQTWIRTEFNLKNINITEVDCFVHACVYLMANLPRKDVLEDVDWQTYARARTQLEQMHTMMMKFKDVTGGVEQSKEAMRKPDLIYPNVYTENIDSPMAEEPGIFPFVLIICGSGVTAMLVHQDGSFTMLDGSPRGGRAFLGLGSLLTESKTFDELMVLAEKGTAFNVGLSNRYLSSGVDDKQENMYTLIADDKHIGDEMAFFFGQAVGKTLGQFQKEDVVRCLLEMTVQDLVYFAHYACTLADVKHVLFTGSFVHHPLVMQIISKEWLYRQVNMALYAQKPMGRPAFHFLKHGAYLGTLGAYLNSKMCFMSESGNIKEGKETH